MDLDAAIGRLHKAGEEYQNGLTQIREAVDDIATYLSSIDLAQETNLGEYIFTWYPSREYTFEHNNPNLNLTRTHKTTQALLYFALVVEGGWLDRISEILETHGKRTQKASRAVSSFLLT